MAYYQYLKEAVHSQDVLMAATEKGKAEGLKEGIEKSQSNIVRRMVEKGISVEKIFEMTGIEEKVIRRMIK